MTATYQIEYCDKKELIQPWSNSKKATVNAGELAEMANSILILIQSVQLIDSSKTA